MDEKTKNIAKGISIFILVGLICISVLFVLNLVSCVSLPKEIKGEPMQCTEMRHIAYYSAVTPKDKMTEGSVSESVRACNSTLRYSECKKDRQSYVDSHPKTGDRYIDLLTDNIAKGIMDTCLLNLKP